MKSFIKNMGIPAIISFLALNNPANGQDAFAVCNNLALSGLIDTSSSTTKREQARIEIDLFCSEKDKFESNFSSRSRGFSASFKRVASSFGIGGSSGSNSGYTKSDFEKICSDHRESLRDDYYNSVDISTGGILAKNVVDCANIVKNITYIYGSVTTNFSGNKLILDINRVGGAAPGALKFQGIEPTNDFVNCTTGGKNAVGKELVSEIAISCSLSDDVIKVHKAVKGVVSFCNAANDCRNLEFTTAIKGYEEEIIANRIADLTQKLEALNGAVVGFSTMPGKTALHPSCPPGWAVYAPAEGMFVRGYDRNGTNDPRVKADEPSTWKPVGTQWDDTFRAHSHGGHLEIGAEPTDGKAQSLWPAGAHGRIGVEYDSPQFTHEVGGAETAPKHVVLLYCVKQ
ncbi:hypothetical protein FIU93_17830 [Labrenzia sp. THAF35]|uniref:hypothetical protein n=1 Tax=Labrenzia sp. THAF35 TaxID=2587854 RepID=UPI0012682109|nr:hypothetical protein [Labrenzia sp. THAF35]QFT68657.1 hypothetical protein FIU93_17830 [Labrenzia sp. THAF35]